jgi:hypothetical protein
VALVQQDRVVRKARLVHPALRVESAQQDRQATPDQLAVQVDLVQPDRLAQRLPVRLALQVVLAV